MLLKLQKYDINLEYKKGKEMYLADALFRAYPKDSAPQTEPQSEFCHQLEEVSLSEHLPFSVELMQQFRDETGKDSSLQVLMQVISVGWPDNKKVVPLEVRAYFHCRDKLSVQNGLILKSDRVFVPTSLRADMMKKLQQ